MRYETNEPRGQGHEARQQVVNQYLHLYFPTQPMKNKRVLIVTLFHKLQYRFCKSNVWNCHQPIRRC
mgnify:CR=1 FL=1